MSYHNQHLFSRRLILIQYVCIARLISLLHALEEYPVRVFTDSCDVALFQNAIAMKITWLHNRTPDSIRWNGVLPYHPFASTFWPWLYST